MFCDKCGTKVDDNAKYFKECGTKIELKQNERAETETTDADEQFDLGFEYYDKQDYPRAVYWFTKAAAQGDMEAQYMVGHCYYSGLNGMEQNYKEASYWFAKAAEQGEIGSQYLLGMLYLTGDGGAKDSNKAVYWLTKAAEQDNAEAQYSLGMCYSGIEGVTKDDKQAVYWLTKSVEQGYMHAQKSLKQLQEKASKTNSPENVKSKPVNSKQNIAEEVEKRFFGSLMKTNSWGKSLFTHSTFGNLKKFLNREMLDNAKSAYAPFSNSEQMLLFFDNTITGSGKDGFIITDKHIYYNTKYQTGKIVLNEIKKVEYESKNLFPNIILEGDSFFVGLPCRGVSTESVKYFVAVFLEMIAYIDS